MERVFSGKPSGVIMHIALQGCLKAGSIPYGLTADTGGHIRYLLELVAALAECPEVSHQIIVTRAFDDPHLGTEYNQQEEKMTDSVTLWRCQGHSTAYLSKEELWKEVPHLADCLISKMQHYGIRPNLVHAHYADAGVVAMRLKAASGIPYVFTAHSLGATKAQHRPANSDIGKDLRRRIRYEELAIKHADQLIASSEHEAQIQYGLYKSNNARKTLVNPPGCHVENFRRRAPAPIAKQIDSELKRFLREPDRPCILALARPVEKKNLCALVRAYGEHPNLRNQANLVIYAGTRREIDLGEPEARHVWQQLLKLIDQYDLYGHVAYPKHHTLEQVPAIYQWAAKRRGVFANPALIEPFGLTLLEAAASGLPVVATQEGGPVDILNRCGHGLLVAPSDIRGIADACHRLISNDIEWQHYSSHGHRNVDFYTWFRHARQYVLDMDLAVPADPIPFNVRRARQLLATDMDGTLLGDRDGLKRLAIWLAQNRHYLFVIATGRSVAAALRELEIWKAPLPDFLITDVGSSIYRIDCHRKTHLIHSWHRQLDTDWQRDECERLLSRHSALELQPQNTQSAYKLSFFIRATGTNTPGPRPMTASSAWHNEAIKKEVEKVLMSAGLVARVVHSHGNLLDVLPEAGGKAKAVEFLRKRFTIDRQKVVASGDSGNDTDLLQYAALGIVVANHTGELESLRDCRSLYWADADYANGILEGLERFENPKKLSQPMRRIPEVNTAETGD
ncbi:sucrose-phosphate synthase [Marinobacter sp. LV10MA510-1]|nr:sucrose-phosphate synthase [Marinobacter sp. LV10MA510-1]PFG51576.1 sucrose-phosphate synthase [Marinobacter sp. LV10R520-4]